MGCQGFLGLGRKIKVSLISKLSEGFMRYLGSSYDSKGRVERETRLELATLCLGSRCSTTELLPHKRVMAICAGVLWRVYSPMTIQSLLGKQALYR